MEPPGGRCSKIARAKMRRSAATILLLGLLLPAVGQSDRLRPEGFSQFAPRGRASATGETGRPGNPAATGNRPRGYQPGGNRPSLANSGVNGQRGASPQRDPRQGNPALGLPVGDNSQAGVPNQLPKQGFLLDARNARAEHGRVPNGFGQLGLSDVQRQRIYGIQALYDSHIERLEALIERLEAEEDVQYQYVLTPAQRRIYQRYLAEKERQ